MLVDDALLAGGQAGWLCSKTHTEVAGVDVSANKRSIAGKQLLTVHIYDNPKIAKTATHDYS